MTGKRRIHGLPPAQGLYNPAHEHDACGIGFVANIVAKKSHDIVLKGIADPDQSGASRRLRLRSGDRRRRGHADSDPAQVFRARGGRAWDLRCPIAGEYGVGMVFLPVETQQRLQCEGILERIVREEGLDGAGLARHAGRRQRHRPRGARIAALYRADFRRPARACITDECSSASCMSCANARRARSPRREIRRQGHSSTFRRSRRGPSFTKVCCWRRRSPNSTTSCPIPIDERAVPGAPALLHEHVSDLAACASVSATSATTARSTRCAET